MVVIGDVHGQFEAYELLCKRFEGEVTVQIGDMGIGFPDGRNPVVRGSNYFFRGNHDNPEVANSYANCLGDYGTSVLGPNTFFFVAGAWSIDWKMRREGVSWWRDEELSISALNDAVAEYVKCKPRVMLSHDCPSSVADKLLNRYLINGTRSYVYPTRTGQALQAMFELHQPEIWIFGHYHTDWTQTINGTKFTCLNELSHITV